MELLSFPRYLLSFSRALVRSLAKNNHKLKMIIDSTNRPTVRARLTYTVVNLAENVLTIVFMSEMFDQIDGNEKLFPLLNFWNNETKRHDELFKNNWTQQYEHQQNQLDKLLIGNINVNVTIDDIYELFGLQTYGLIPTLKCI